MSQVPARFQCRYIHAAGHRCGSPALRGESFCLFHHGSRKPQPAAPEQPATFDLPVPEDHTAILLGIGEVLRRIARGTLDKKPVSSSTASTTASPGASQVFPRPDIYACPGVAVLNSTAPYRLRS